MNKCDQCSFETYSKEGLEAHKERKHKRNSLDQFN